MRLLKLNDTALSAMEFSDFVDGLTEHVFMRFMDIGRQGITAGAMDCIDTSIARWCEAKNKVWADRLVQLDESGVYGSMNKYYTKKMIDGFIKSGSEGLRLAIFMLASDEQLYR